MSREAEFIQSELPDIAKIIRDECWLEGERRGRAVDPHDAAVIARVTDIILGGAGAAIRLAHEQMHR